MLTNLDQYLGREQLADLPTPISTHIIENARISRTIAVKHDNLTSEIYGGNKVRKLEFALRPAERRSAKRIATFGTIGSHHALATAIYSRKLGYECTCFLSHQATSPEIRAVLAAHVANGTHLVRYGGSYARRLATLREHLWPEKVWVVPAGGSSWLGTMGYVDAGLELSRQVAAREITAPDRIYIAAGTLGSAVGLAIGLSISGLASRIEAIRVSPPQFCNEQILQRLTRKTLNMMQRFELDTSATIPNKINLRHEFFAGGYARNDNVTREAIAFADSALGLTLEATYTGKAMAALLHDLPDIGDESILFWNTYNSAPLRTDESLSLVEELPEEFHRYLL